MDIRPISYFFFSSLLQIAIFKNGNVYLEDTHKKNLIGRTTKNGWEVKPPEPLRNKVFFSKKNLSQPHETQEKLMKKMCLFCSVLGNIDQPYLKISFIVILFEFMHFQSI